jgi:hypothetical protein
MVKYSLDLQPVFYLAKLQPRFSCKKHCQDLRKDAHPFCSKLRTILVEKMFPPTFMITDVL